MTGNDETQGLAFSRRNRIVYWWPVWLFGYFLGLVNLSYGDHAVIKQLETGANWHSLLNLIYVFLILFVIFFTSVKTNAITVLLAIAFFVILGLLAYLIAGPDVIVEYIPSFSVFMNARFYFTFSTGLLFVWLFAVFIVGQ